MTVSNPGAIRVLLADDHALVRAGIRALLEKLPGVAVVAEADSGRAAFEQFVAERPDLVVMDISMKEMNGIDAALEIIAEDPDARVLILSMYSSAEFVRRAMRAGARGYLIKDSAPLELRLAVEATIRGDVFVSSRVSKHLVAALGEDRGAAAPSALESLSLRQRQILQMIAEGQRTKGIATALALSVKTVESHRAAIMERLGIRDVAGLILFAVQSGLVGLNRPPE
jgi:DNA-binding NarL/FixJ family response regulator